MSDRNTVEQLTFILYIVELLEENKKIGCLKNTGFDLSEELKHEN